MLQRAIDPLSRPFDDEFERLSRLHSSGRPVRVDFREMVGNSSAAERFTHRFHPYPAKLLLNIPLFFLNCSQLVRPGSVVYDPFCGSGTVLVEALVRGVRACGSDSNPLARLITRAKTTLVSEDSVLNALETIRANLPRKSGPVPEGSVELERWFSPGVRLRLARLLRSIEAHTSGDVAVFFRTCFSTVVSRVSLTDPTVPVPVMLNPRKASLSDDQKRERRRWLKERSEALVYDIFCEVVRHNLARLKRLAEHVHERCDVSVTDDARASVGVEDVDLVISSPPYGSAQKYIRSSCLSLQWLGLAPNGLRDLERLSIGREHFSRAEMTDVPVVAKSSEKLLEQIGRINPLRRQIAATYLTEMRDALGSTYRRVRPGGHVVLVVGNNTVCGRVFDTQRYLTEISNDLGLKLLLRMEDCIRSRGLITKRHSSAGVIGKESILVFRKG